jgi:azurin
MPAGKNIGGALLFIFLLAGCGGKSSSPVTAPTTATGPAVGEIPVTQDFGVQVVEFLANDTMRYNGNHFSVHAGQPVRIELKNTGHTSRDVMAHNVVILQPGADAAVFDQAAATAKAEGYVGAGQLNAVVAHTPLAGPGQTVQVEFTAPVPGEYPFLCTFPGHFVAGMRGTMTATP